MNKTKRITFCGICAALSVVMMLTAYFPYLTYAIPAHAGLFIMLPVLELGKKWAFGTYIAALVPTLLLAEPEAKLLYALIFGYYPILKALADRFPFLLQWLIKLLTVNVAIALAYFIFAPIMGIQADDFGQLGKIGVALFWIAANVVFIFYDKAVAQMSVVYCVRIRPKIKKYLK